MTLQGPFTPFSHVSTHNIATDRIRSQKKLNSLIKHGGTLLLFKKTVFLFLAVYMKTICYSRVLPDCVSKVTFCKTPSKFLIPNISMVSANDYLINLKLCMQKAFQIFAACAHGFCNIQIFAL